MKFIKTVTVPLLAITIITIGLAACKDNGGPSQAVDTTFIVEVQNINIPKPVLKSGIFAQPAGNVPAIEPGETASFSFNAPPSTLPPLGGSGMHLNFATMFVQSNDLFYAFPPEGLDLYDDQGNPVTGDITDQLFLYDAGTKEDTTPGTGPDQKRVQDPTAVNQGADKDFS